MRLTMWRTRIVEYLKIIFYVRELTPRQWVKWLILLFLSILTCWSCVLFFLDPYVYWHRAWFLRQSYTNSYAMIPGILRHFDDYDTIVIGSSMCQNFTLSDIDRYNHTRSVKATSPGLPGRVAGSYLEIALASRADKLKRCIMGVDLWMYTKAEELPRYDYLHRRDQPLRYLFSVDSFDAGMEMLTANFASRSDRAAMRQLDRNYMFCNKYGRYRYTKEIQEKKIRSSSFQAPPVNLEKWKKSVERNLIRYIRENPGVRFDFFLPPYSIYFWCARHEQGTLEEYMAARTLFVRMASPYANVVIHDFQNWSPVVCDGDNYKDETHFSPEISTKIMQELGASGFAVDEQKLAENSARIRAALQRYLPAYRDIFKNAPEETRKTH